MKTNRIDASKNLLTVRECCDILRCSRSTIYRLGKKQALKLYKIGRMVRIDGDDLLANWQ